MAEIYFYIGEDNPVTVQVNGANDSGLDLTAYEGYGLVFYYESDNTVIEKYSGNAATGWNSTNIDTTSANVGAPIALIQRAVSELGRDGSRVMVQVVVQSTDANYASSQFRDLGAPVYAFTFKKGGHSSTNDLS